MFVIQDLFASFLYNTCCILIVCEESSKAFSSLSVELFFASLFTQCYVYFAQIHVHTLLHQYCWQSVKTLKAVFNINIGTGLKLFMLCLQIKFL